MIASGNLYHQPSKLKGYYLFNIILFCLFASLPLAGISYWQNEQPFFQTWGMLAFGLFGVLGIIIYLYLYLEYSFFRFMVSPDGLTINSGIIVKGSRTITLPAIQSIDYTKDPIMAIFGIQQVRVWTSSPQQIEIKDGQTHNVAAATFFIVPEDFEELKKSLLYKAK